MSGKRSTKRASIISDPNPKTVSSSSQSSLLYKDIIELVLLCTIKEEPSDASTSLIYLAELALLHPQKWDFGTVDRALVDRLCMRDLSTQLITNQSEKSSITREVVSENRCLVYLSGCYQRLSQRKDHFESIFNDMEKLFINHTTTAIALPNMYEGQNLPQQWVELLIDSRANSSLQKYVDCVNKELCSSINAGIENFYEKCFYHMYKMIYPLDFFATELTNFIEILENLSQWSELIRIIFRISHPKTSSNRSSTRPKEIPITGRAFEDTLIGSLLSKSCLPALHGRPFLFFDKPKSMNERDIELTSQNMWRTIVVVQENLSNLFRTFLKDRHARNDVLKWIGDCLSTNQGKNKEWSSFDPFAALLFVSDGFLFNLTVVLLNLANPFCQPRSPKLLKIDPFYVISQNETVHLKDLHEETTMINRDEKHKIEKNETIEFNFITENFFMVHLCYSYSIRRLHRILDKICEEIQRLREAYDNSVKLNGLNHDNTRKIDEALEKCLIGFFNIRTVLNEPRLLELSNSLFTATSSWLVHIAVSSQNDRKSSENENLNTIKTLPLTDEPNQILSYLPEFIIENIIDYLKFLDQFNKKIFQTMEPPISEYINLVLVFMGDASRLRNPHLRANLAEVLDNILPHNQDENNENFNTSKIENIFKNHPFMEHLSRILLEVFVSIELTGQAVAFEQKFGYRRPMYKILEYLWKFDQHRTQVKKLAKYAERHIDDAEAPLFLRFINLLMNDANYLLDEALRHMVKLKESEEAKERGEWDQMPEKQREELETAYRQAGRIARFMNIMGLKTLDTLSMITTDIKSIFCHPAICERLAAMVNYFLQHLVGPKRRTLRVRDLKEYLFDPQKLVAKVVDIYLNFSRRDEFCQAVCNDGMSYNATLFPQAVEVLQLIRYPPERIATFVKLGEHIKEVAEQKNEEDAAYDDAPDEYLDPITNILMTEPVMLPTSRKILDRTTIARHLLSDQTDPFNRKPLHMQEVIPQNELKQAIQNWKSSRR